MRFKVDEIFIGYHIERKYLKEMRKLIMGSMYYMFGDTELNKKTCLLIVFFKARTAGLRID